jgi:glycosyltransferase involved in cell wall biosynthesis
MSFKSFRRHPSRYLSRCRPKILGALLQKSFNVLNSGDRLADFLADPRTVLSKTRLSSLLPKIGVNYDTISVIMATRNNELTLARSIRSVLDQTHNHIELIIIDDASDDDSFKIIREAARGDHRVKFQQNCRQLGTGATRNVGMKLASGTYITFQDGDDFSAPERLERQLDALRQFPSKKVCLCNYVRVDKNHNRLLINDRRVMKCIISMMFPRTEALATIGYFLDQTVSEDAEYYERLKIAFGSESEILVFGTLYEALFTENSSLFSAAIIEERRGRIVRYRRSAKAEKEWNHTQERLERIRRGDLSIHVSFEQGQS